MSLTTTLTYDGGDLATSGGVLLSSGASANAVLGDASDATYIYFVGGGTVEWSVGGYSDLPPAQSVESVTITTRHRRGVGSDVAETHKVRGVVRISGTNYYTAYATCVAGYTDTVHTAWTTNPATGTPWTPVSVNAAWFGMEISSDAIGVPPSSPEGARIIVSVTYWPLPTHTSPVRHVVSKELFDKLRPIQWATIRGGVDLLRLSLFDTVDVEHIAVPESTGEGAGAEVWERWPGSVRSIDFDPATMTVDVLLKGLRGRRALLWEQGYSGKSSGVIEDGIAYFGPPSSTRTFTRDSEATFTNPVGETEVVPIDVPEYNDFGLQIQSAVIPIEGPPPEYRGADELSWTNNSEDDGRVWNAAQGTFHCEVRLDTVSALGNQTVLYVYHNADNFAVLVWDGANSRWTFEIRAGGTFSGYATHSFVPTAGVGVQLGARWTGANSENGDPEYTASIFVNRVKGTDVVVSGAMIQQATSTLWIGTRGGAGLDPLEGAIRKIISTQEVFTDTEMMRTI